MRSWWASRAFLALERLPSAVTFDIHLEDRGVMNQTVNGGKCHSLIWKDLAPFAEWLVSGNHQRPMFISRADELEENAGFDLVLTDVCKIVQNHQMILIELGDRGFEGKLAASDLKLLNQFSCSREQQTSAVLNKSKTDGSR